MAVPQCLTAAILLPFLLLVSCAAPKAEIVEESQPTIKPAEEPVAEVPMEPEPLPDDGLRLPDSLLALPGDSEFRSTQPLPGPSESGAVIARPPTDPPPRPKSGD